MIAADFAVAARTSRRLRPQSPMQYSRRAPHRAHSTRGGLRSMANKFEATVERWVFNSRWLLAPFFIGLLLAIAALLVKFVQAFARLAFGVLTQALSDNDLIIDILTLVDGALVGALLLIIGFAG